jgi:hypothetical protein
MMSNHSIHANLILMPIRSYQSRSLIFSLLCSAAQLAMAAAPVPKQAYPVMTQGEREYANTCSPKEKKILRAALRDSKVPDQEQAWRLIDSLLCAEKAPANQRLIRNAMARKIKAKYDGTGQDTSFETITPSDEAAERLMAGGAAWQARFEPAESDGWQLSYWADEATVSSYTIDYKKAKWIITGYGSASD